MVRLRRLVVDRSFVNDLERVRQEHVGKESLKVRTFQSGSAAVVHINIVYLFA